MLHILFRYSFVLQVWLSCCFVYVWERQERESVCVCVFVCTCVLVFAEEQMAMWICIQHESKWDVIYSQLTNLCVYLYLSLAYLSLSVPPSICLSGIVTNTNIINKADRPSTILLVTRNSHTHKQTSVFCVDKHFAYHNTENACKMIMNDILNLNLSIQNGALHI